MRIVSQMAEGNHMTLTNIDRFLDQLGDEARSIAMQHFRTEIDVETKCDSTPVTTADRAIERRLREIISSRYPAHTLVGEEEGGRIADGFSWVIDPIDGTKSFVTGLPLFGTLVAMLEDRRPVCGMIEVSAMRERWIGVADRTSCNGEPCAVSACMHLRDARLCSTDPRMFSGEAERAFVRLAREVRVTRFGTDCYGYAMLASGHVDLVIEDGLQVHDVMAIVPVIHGAGGIITTWSGGPIDETFEGNIIAAATQSLHDEASRWLGQP
ncbi:inositol monophosphatase family protein [Caballeronia ptereochthonis]|nr:inositol monophosphatase family protein [Caballeronia ptereochthonis]